MDGLINESNNRYGVCYRPDVRGKHQPPRIDSVLPNGRSLHGDEVATMNSCTLDHTQRDQQNLLGERTGWHNNKPLSHGKRTGRELVQNQEG